MSPDNPGRTEAHKTIVKICGLTRESDVDAACAAQAQYVGFVLYSGSARHVSIERARMLAERLPSNVLPVLVVVDADELDVTAIHDYFTATDQHFVIQFHGRETPQRCHEIASRLQRPYWRAAAVPFDPPGLEPLSESLTERIVKYCASFVGCNALLLDSEVAAPAHGKQSQTDQAAVFGGTGQRFDWELVNWSLLKQSAASRLVLSGGLTAANVADGIKQVRPWAVDVSSGVEVQLANGQLQRGIKDPAKITEFMAAVRAGDASLRA